MSDEPTSRPDRVPGLSRFSTLPLGHFATLPP